MLPTGRACDHFEVPGLGTIEASLVDAANPCVFVAADSLGKGGDEMPDALENDPVFLARMEAIRCAASVAMGLAPDVAVAAKIPSVPKVAMIVSPRQMTTLSGRHLEPSEMSLGIRMISISQPHRAVPITGATCLAIAVRIKGTLANRMARAGDGPIVIAHPSGTTVVDAAVEHADAPAKARAIHGAVYRTARRLFEGNVFYRTAKTAAQARRSAYLYPEL
ncbi:2-methylaconitate cis-trans isomerase PrpF family protein [Bradyrhizobium sp. 44]|uniref:2-methylaconitate cis-trans isomerase PrpF family protein n=1 Tax=Bradyrhizobium sp. 44 TaxID=2782675 RepID=UPI001FF88DC2